MTADDVATAALRAMQANSFMSSSRSSRACTGISNDCATWLLKKIARMFAAGLKAAAADSERRSEMKETVANR